jgi:hypothetical protein
MVLYYCVLIVFSLRRELLKLILATDPLPRWFCHNDSASTSRHDQVTLAASSLAWLDNIVASMIRYLHRATTKSHQQWLHQHDSATTLRHDRRCLDSVITSLTWQRHHTMAKSPRWYRADMTRQRLHVAANIGSATPSPAWLGGSVRTSSTIHLTQRFITDHALGREEYHSNRKPDSGTRLLMHHRF